MLAEMQLEITRLADAALDQFRHPSLHSRPSERGEERVFRGLKLRLDRQTDVIDRRLARAQRLLVEGQDAAYEVCEKFLKLRRRDSSVDPSVPFGGIGVIIIRAQDNFERP